MRKRRPKRRTLINALDRATSRLVRLRNATRAGYVKCYTCNRRLHWKKAQAGHFQSRAKYPTRWDYKRNIRCQCAPCNMRGGEQFKFARRLDKEHGYGFALAVEKASESKKRFTDYELELMLMELQIELKKYAKY